MSENHDNVITVFIVFIALIVYTSFIFEFSFNEGKERIEKEAIKMGVAKYVITDTNCPDGTFTWITH